MTATTFKLVPDTWTLVATAPAGNLTFQNLGRGDIWLVAGAAMPSSTPIGLKYAAKEGETDITLATLFPNGGANLYAYSQLAQPFYINFA